MKPVLVSLLALISTWLRSRRSMQREIVALRHQLGVYQKARCRPRINPADRLLQERWLGRLTPAEKKALAALARGKGNPNPGAIKAGTRLYRSWQGVTHEVLVMDSGYTGGTSPSRARGPLVDFGDKLLTQTSRQTFVPSLGRFLLRR